MRRTKNIMILVDPEFHKKINEERVKIEKALGYPITNTKVTKIIARKGIIKIPKRFDMIKGEFI